MFGLFGDNSKLQLDEETRLWLDEAMFWLFDTFGDEAVKSRKILTPTHEDLPITFDGQYATAEKALEIIADQMEIDIKEVKLDFYVEGHTQMSSGTRSGGAMFMQPVEGESYSGGKYWGRQEDGKYHIWLEARKLNQPLELMATLAHELAHIKLLGEGRVEENNEPLTDLTTIVFGLGIFNANASFQYKQETGYSAWSKLGYLTQMEWGYALAFFAYMRGEREPEWINHLSTNIKSDFKKSINYIDDNADIIFADDDEV